MYPQFSTLFVSLLLLALFVVLRTVSGSEQKNLGRDCIDTPKQKNLTLQNHTKWDKINNGKIDWLVQPSVI